MGRAAFVPQRREISLMGGETSNGVGATANHVFARIDAFNVDTRTWRRLATVIPTPRHSIYPPGPLPMGALASVTEVASIIVARWQASAARGWWRSCLCNQAPKDHETRPRP